MEVNVPSVKTKLLPISIFHVRRGVADGGGIRRIDGRRNRDVVFAANGHSIDMKRKLYVKRNEGDVRFIYICVK
jgi:hypothetical protein